MGIFITVLCSVLIASEGTMLDPAMIQGQIQALQLQVNNIIVASANNNRQVAFSGRMHNKLPLSGSAIVRFDDVITNIGNAYSQATGIFHCPINGLYLFTCSILSDTIGYVSVSIYQNGRRIARPYTGAAGGGLHDSASDTVVVHGNAGDEIYIENVYGTSAYLDEMSLFTGVLLKAD